MKSNIDIRVAEEDHIQMTVLQDNGVRIVGQQVADTRPAFLQQEDCTLVVGWKDTYDRGMKVVPCMRYRDQHAFQTHPGTLYPNLKADDHGARQPVRRDPLPGSSHKKRHITEQELVAEVKVKVKVENGAEVLLEMQTFLFQT